MANVVFTEVIIEGDRRELRSLYGKMRRLERRARPLVDNNFHHPNRWLGCLVTRMGHDWHDVYCRGTWDFLQMRGGLLSFDTETAWDAPL